MNADGRIRPVTSGKAIPILSIALLAVFVLFDVTFVFDIAGAGRQELPDPAAEAAYEECYRQKDEEIHTTAFGTIDNPDVQREFIASNRARAAAECRRLHPERMITVEEPARFNLVDIEPRFW